MILTVSDKKKWKAILRILKSADVFYSWEFAKLQPNAKLYVYSNKYGMAILPFYTSKAILNSFRYGGLLTTNYTESFHKNCSKDLLRYCRDKCIERIRIRKHPFIKTIQIGKLIKKEPFVYVDLGEKKLNLDASISKKHFSCINKARKNGVEIYESDNLKYLRIFYKMYKTLLAKKAVLPEKFSYFIEMSKYLGKDLSFSCAKYKNKIIAISIILKSNKNLFMMYGAMTDKGYNLYAKHLMIYELILKYKAKKYSRLVLGTGNLEHDSIYKFKSAFTNRTDHIFTYEKKP